MSFFVSTMFPNAMSWANLNLRLNWIAVMWLMLGSSTGGLFYQYFTGYFFDKHGPESLTLVCLFGAFAIGVAYFMLVVTSCCEGGNRVGIKALAQTSSLTVRPNARPQMITWYS